MKLGDVDGDNLPDLLIAAEYQSFLYLNHQTRFDGTPDWQPSSVFERETDDRWRTVSGPEHGEALRIVRGPDGSVEQMVWAGYPVTREPGPWRAPE